MKEQNGVSTADAIALYTALMLSFTALLAGITTVYALMQVKAMRDQISTTQFFEKVKLTKEVLDDPKVVDPFRWLGTFLNTFPFPTCLADARLKLHVQNHLAFSDHTDPEIDKESLNMIRALTYLAQLSRYGAILEDLYFERSAIELVQAYYCFQGIIDYSQRESYMTADVVGFAQRAWKWLETNSPRTLENYRQLGHGFATVDELRELAHESGKQAAAIKGSTHI